ncbi:MAG: hypothetical protein R2835_00620 [Thermomicrobiales bacterium]
MYRCRPQWRSTHAASWRLRDRCPHLHQLKLNAQAPLSVGAYVPAAVTSALEHPAMYTITVDGEEVQARSSLVLVANSAQLLHSRIHLVDDVSRTDGKFDVLIYTASNPVSLAAAGLTSLTGKLESFGQVIRLRGSHIRIDAEPPAPTELDGEVVGVTPLEIEVLPGAIELIRG